MSGETDGQDIDVRYTGLELYLHNGGLNVNLSLADDATPQHLAGILVALTLPEVQAKILKLVLSKLEETKDYEFITAFKNKTQVLIEEDYDEPIIKPSEVLSRLSL